MKFTEGMWRLKEGVRIDWMGNVERLSIDNETVDLLLNKLQRHRGDTLNSATITAQITSPLEGVIGVNLVHWAGALDQGPHFELASSTGHVQVAHIERESLRYSSGPLSLTITTAPNELELSFTGADKPTTKLTGHSWRSIGYVSDQTTEKSRWEDGLYLERQGYMLAELDLGVGEKLYGLGERFGPFIKNGQTVDIWNEDGGTSSELAYKNIPFYVSSAGYGVFVNNPGKVSFELQSERTTRVNISIPGEELQYFVVYGSSPKEILRRYTALTGRPSLVPAWSYNLWLTTSFTTNYDEQTVTGFLDGFRDRDIPLGVFHFDCFWMKSYQWCDFDFDSDMFPDAAGYIQRLKERGLRISVWLNPYIGQASPLFREGKENGYFIKRTDGTIFQWDNWQAGMAIIDFTNPSARTWFSNKLTHLLNLGIDSFKTDFGERIPYKNILYHDPSLSPTRMHNYYTYLYNQTVHSVLLSHPNPTPNRNAILFSRSATVGSQRHPIHWSGDSESSFPAMAEVLRGCLSLSLSGFIFNSTDIGGFEGTPHPSVYKRWIQFGLLSTHSRLHGSNSYRVPWLFDNQAVDILRNAVKRKIALSPYLLSSALAGSQTGVAVMRPLFVEFPTDWNVYALDGEYMLGDELLVAPIFREDGVVRFYVPHTHSKEGNANPDGKWISWFDHEKVYEGGKWYEETHGFETLPLLIRPGAVIPVNWKMKGAEDDPLDGLEVLVNGRLEGEVKVQIVNPDCTDEVLKVVTVGVGPDGGVVVDKEGVRVVCVGC
ncbi:putative sugar hydrolase [Aspergillus sclerotiicarbonarius CBS 121057]|uniref:alpha-D-xyloside xylohydrolase n=1 Tax=Aspergillus sclerotiicarbonarius (strain CBS 121057 / IBT 28362) TaxID=1448318 RepID=A0A319DVQ5_ASPSB|nr:putative sugar hydrolase [Aspergillus sclerotiicarbonarius CBS 121057]